MKSLTELELDTCSCTWYYAAKTSTRKKMARLLRRSSVEKYINSRYSQFKKIVEDVTFEPIPCDRKKLGAIFHDFYYRPPKKLKELLQYRRNEHKLEECPSCGNPFIPDTLDHFLPKEDWPEYSILPNNLVPQCRGCAPVKGDKYFCKKEGAALFLHPIYTGILEEVMFKIDVQVDKEIATFSVSVGITNSVGVDDKARIQRHMDKLAVNSRIQEFCVRQYARWKYKLADSGGEIDFIFRALLGSKLYEIWGENWSIAFMLGVLRNPEAVIDLQRYSATTPIPAPRTIRAIN